MPRRTGRQPADDPALDAGKREPSATADPRLTPAAAAATGSLADLPVAGLTRRRMALLIAALVAAWVIVLFARQISEASDAALRADAARTSNAALTVEVAGLQQELQLIQQQAYIEQQARTYRLGSAQEIPFTLADDAPALAPNAPGSASVRLGATTTRPSPLESWLDLLFGTSGAPGG
jgi:cell division protein FtsB